MVRKTIFAIGDQHLPFLHKPTFEKILVLTELIKPHYIVMMGDLYDLYSFSKFTKRLNMTAQDELSEGRKMAEEMFRLLKMKSPESIIYTIRGNHDERLAARVYEKFGSDLESVMSYRELWKFDGVNTVFDPKEVLTIEGVDFTHGHLGRLGDHMRSMDFRNVVTGHSHTGGVMFHRLHTGEIRFELNAGYTGDPFHPALLYRPLKKYFGWTHGLGIIDPFGPRFCPLTEQNWPIMVSQNAQPSKRIKSSGRLRRVS